ncbi:MFS transporter [Sphingopyxis sp. DHUNG17]|uniref:MFS transporter n=1 Tax=Sphingopyxis jiangsuensis TaxID=2871171 RepID=UPI00191F1C12|nr:MFS transporter [Sphingopyxis lutea]MBL0770111.1 MFS transporter [Sphingopyxis lutea]
MHDATTTIRNAALGGGSSIRWRICALLFVATTINYLDRQLLGILKPVLDREIGWSEADYGYVVFSFQLAYAIGLTGAGWLLDRIGSRLGYALATASWSLAIAFHGLAGGVWSFAATRFGLGLSEAGNYPAAIKTVAEHFPQHERSLATGLFNAGSNVGAMLAPLLVPLILAWFDWHWVFVLAAIPGALWVGAWLALTPASPESSVSPTEAVATRPLREIVRLRGTWAYALAKFLTDPVWWFFLFWLPDFLSKSHGLAISEFALPLFTVYLIADVGSIAGGWGASALMRRGWSVDAARKGTMLVCAIAALPVAMAPTLHALWPTILLISLGVAAHQAWSSNLLTLVSDLVPARDAASVAGFGGTIGAVGGMAMAWSVGHILEAGLGYQLIFVAAASAYLLALGIIQILVPRLGTVAD